MKFRLPYEHLYLFFWAHVFCLKYGELTDSLYFDKVRQKLESNDRKTI